MIKGLISVLYMFLSTSVFAAPPKQSTIEAKATITKDKKLNLVVKAIPNTGTVINKEGHWTVDIKESPVAFANKSLKPADFDAKIPGFSLTSTEAVSKPGTIKYTFVVFVCTADKAKCYRDEYRDQTVSF